MMRYEPTVRTCMDCSSPFFDTATLEVASSRCGGCEMRYQIQIARLHAFLGAPR